MSSGDYVRNTEDAHTKLLTADLNFGNKPAGARRLPLCEFGGRLLDLVDVLASGGGEFFPDFDRNDEARDGERHDKNRPPLPVVRDDWAETE